MDPNENLKKQLELARHILDLVDGGVTAEGPRPNLDYVVADAEQLAEHALALDEWRCKGGFLPERWNG